MLTGKEQPDSGEIKIGETVNIVSVGQERMEQLNAEKTVFEEISEGLDEIELGTQSINSRAYLSWFGFKGQSQQAKVSNKNSVMSLIYYIYDDASHHFIRLEICLEVREIVCSLQNYSRLEEI